MYSTTAAVRILRLFILQVMTSDLLSRACHENTVWPPYMHGFVPSIATLVDDQSIHRMRKCLSFPFTQSASRQLLMPR